MSRRCESMCKDGCRAPRCDVAMTNLSRIGYIIDNSRNVDPIPTCTDVESSKHIQYALKINHNMTGTFRSILFNKQNKMAENLWKI